MEEIIKEKCKYCGKGPWSKSGLARHIWHNKECYDSWVVDLIEPAKVEMEKYLSIYKFKCNYCSKRTKTKKGLQTHRITSKKCTKLWVEDQIELAKLEMEEDLKLPKIECKECGLFFRYINNTHLATKHNGMTIEQYIEKHPGEPVFTKDLIEEQKNNRENTINTKYTKEEIKYLKGEKGIKVKEAKSGLTIGEYCKLIHKLDKEKDPLKYEEVSKKLSKSLRKFYIDILPVEKEELEKRRLEKRIKTNLEKYGVEFTQNLPEVKAKQKKTLIENLGPDAYTIVANKRREIRKKKYGKYSNFFPNFSFNSQELFKELAKLLPRNLTVYYAINGEDKNNEYQVHYRNCDFTRFLDFYVKELNKCIEFNEEHHNTEEQQKKDKKRYNEIKGCIKEIKILVIDEKEYLKNKK